MEPFLQLLLSSGAHHIFQPVCQAGSWLKLGWVEVASLTKEVCRIGSWKAPSLAEQESPKKLISPPGAATPVGCNLRVLARPGI